MAFLKLRWWLFGCASKKPNASFQRYFQVLKSRWSKSMPRCWMWYFSIKIIISSLAPKMTSSHLHYNLKQRGKVEFSTYSNIILACLILESTSVGQLLCAVRFDKICLCFCIFQGGVYVFNLLETFSAGVSLFFVVLMELVVVGWIYGKCNFTSSHASICEIRDWQFLRSALWVGSI